MAGKSNKSKNKVKGSSSNTPNISIQEAKTVGALIPPKDETPVASKPSSVSADGLAETNPADPSMVSNNLVDENAKSVGEAQPPNPNQVESELCLYPVSVKSQTGENLELQLSPGDSVMDVRQFLLDAPETCFFTCYDMILHTKDDGALHHLEDYNEISEIADITTGGCSIDMVPSLYDDKSIRSHIHRTRDLLSLSNHQPSLSTSFGLQHEAAQMTDAAKTEAPELEEIGFMDDISGSVCNLFPELPNDIVCIHSIVFSSFNPPPSYRRLVGDLIYIDVVTLEGTKLCITGRTKSFYVNSSTGNMLDPRPSKMNSEATTLIGLLQKISTKFKIGFREILERKALSHPFENVQSLLPPNSWTGAYPIPDHKRDAARAEDALSLSYGTELIGMQRDWNEELQSCREFPHITPQERILRDRALYKVTCDFVDAAISGAVGVINRCIQPINPTDPECFHMYVHNNIFFSFAVDADIGQISKEQSSSSKQKLWKDSRIVSNSQFSEEASVNVLNGNGHSKSVSTNSNKPEDGSEITSDDPSEAQFVDSEQATYASANNDLKGTKAYQETDISGLYNLAMAIIDYRGHRVVAQSIIPGILQGDKSDSLLYGSVDNGKKIAWNESFHSKVLEAAKHLHIKEHTVLDGAGKSVKLAAPVECKGIVGSDNRHYILDLMRATPRDVNYSGPNSRFCVLRPELIASFCQTEAETMSKCTSNGAVDAPAEPAMPISEDNSSPDTSEQKTKSSAITTEKSSSTIRENTSEEILLNPNVFTEFKIAGSEEEIAADEEGVKKATSYLVEVVLPKFVKDLCSLDVSPMDGQTLTDALHAHGINIRYLGKIASDIKRLPHLWDIFTTEIIVRSAKHILKEMLRESQDHDLAPAVSHFLNCFTGSISPGSIKDMSLKTQKKDHTGHTPARKSTKKSQTVAAPQLSHSASYMLLTTDSLWSHIQEFAKAKYQFELQEDARSRVKKLFVIRNLCLKMGISIAARTYNFEAASPFKTLDICNLLPVVKHSVPACSEAKDLIENGKVRLTEGMLNEAYAIFSEAFSLLQQVTGPMHRDVANCCRYLAMVLYHAGDMAGAIMQQHKELIINERCLGLDHPDTAHSYGNMALFYHGLNQTQLSMRHMSRTLLLLSLSSGPEHPDVASTFINVAMMYQDAGKMNTALRYLQEALKKNERLLGPEHIQTGVCYHALAIAFNCIGAYKLSFQHETKTHEIFNKQLGSDDSRTRDSDNWVKTFKMRDLQVNAQKQKMQSIDASSAQKTIEMLKANPDLLQAFQNAAVRSSKSTASPRIHGDSLPRGKGADERAARAAAEVRKKATARGIPVHAHGVPVQATPALAQLLNIINASAAPEAPSMIPRKGNVKGSSSSSSNSGSSPGGAPTQDENSGSEINTNDEAPPVGLGVGLSPKNDPKKQKPKKVTAS